MQLPHGGWFNGKFWRPLGVLTSKVQVTYLWKWDWAVHLCGALAHAWATAAVYWFLLRVCRWRPLAGAGALVFLTYGPGWEVVYWPMSTSASFAVVCVMWGFLRVIAYAEGVSAWRTLTWIGLAAFLIPCLFEQLAPWPAAIPFLYLAFCRDEERWAVRLKRAAVASAVCVPGCALYLVLMISTMDEGDRGGAGSFVSLGELVQRVPLIAGHVVKDMGMQGFWKGAIEEGMGEVARLRRAGPLAIAAVLIAAWFWLRPWIGFARADATALAAVAERETADSRSGGGGEAQPRLVWLLLFSAAGFVAAWLTVVVTRDQPVLFRLCQAPVVFLIVAACGVLDAQIVKSARRWFLPGAAGARAGIVGAGARAAALGATLWLCAWGTLVMIGAASVMKARSEQDYREGARLKELVPDPPRNAVFVPLHVWNPTAGVVQTPALESIAGVWLWHWAPFRFVQMIYNREDIATTHYHRDQRGLPFEWIDERGWQYKEFLGGNFGKPGEKPRPIRWDEVIPFVILRDGTMHLVESVTIVKRDGSERVMGVPLVEKLCTGEESGCVRWIVREGERGLREEIDAR